MKTAGKIAIASGVLLAIGGIAYAASPKFRVLVKGATGTLTPHEKLQVEIDGIIKNKSFLVANKAGKFIEATYNFDLQKANDGARKYIFEMANATVNLPNETWQNFTYGGLTVIDEFYPVHVAMQHQISRIMNDDSWGDWLDMTLHGAGGKPNSTDYVAQEVFDAATDSTGSNPTYTGNKKSYWYNIIGGDDQFYKGGQADEVRWYKSYFTGAVLGAGQTTTAGGTTAQSNSGSGSSSGNQNYNIGGTIEEGIGYVEDLFCQIFPDSCAPGTGAFDTGIGDDYSNPSDPNQGDACPGGFLSYDPLTNNFQCEY